MALRSAVNVSSDYSKFTGPNLAYLSGLYEQYKQDPTSVPEDIRSLFEDTGSWIWQSLEDTLPLTAKTQVSPSYIKSVLAARQLADNIREYGHLAARTGPTDHSRREVSALSLATYGLTEDVLQTIPASLVWPNAPLHVRTALDAVETLRKTYTGVIAYDFAHVTNLQERAWLDDMVETGGHRVNLSPDMRVQLLHRLSEVEAFEKFLHRTYVGQKRFSIEGLDMLVPMLDTLVHLSVSGGARDIMIGMAHRGRLNVLAHVLGKPYEKIFAEFQSAPNKEHGLSEGSEGIHTGWTGDVKYHLGAFRTVENEGAVKVRIRLANNPSHLEFVNPVVLGYTRAAQETRATAGEPTLDPKSALAVLVHGDAAFPGEGVVAETFNFSQIRGYSTGGTIHIIANNRLGFTAEEDETRSTSAASDLAKGFEVPVVHVSADNPEACLMAIRLASLYRAKFGKDFLINLIGYRRWGHNEMDDPSVTQPTLYQQIQKHPTVRALYAQSLREAGVISESQASDMESEVNTVLREVHANVDRVSEPTDPKLWDLPTQEAKPVSLETLQSLNEAMMARPETFHVYPKLAKVLDRRRDALSSGDMVDWAHAEVLAFASILADGTPIRLTGQDTERGTFAHRHVVLHDALTGEEYVPLKTLPQAKASFDVHNSPLTETAVLGFEYGYNVQAPETFVLWEAQFGDFANVAQVIIDQFIVSGLAKWGQSSGLVLLLPHGYEGQGPEHSSARVERYLQLAAAGNIVVANVTTSAQYFHLLRRQAARLGKNARPLFLMTPKSLLRNPRASSPPQDLANGRFQPVLSIAGEADPARVRRLVLSSGKVGVDLVASMESPNASYNWLAHGRIEQLYPFPKDDVARLISRYPGLREVIWLQEEPENMGAWRFVLPHLQALTPNAVRLRYIGRAESASPAEGHASEHHREQTRILNEALDPGADSDFT